MHLVSSWKFPTHLDAVLALADDLHFGLIASRAAKSERRQGTLACRLCLTHYYTGHFNRLEEDGTLDLLFRVEDPSYT